MILGTKDFLIPKYLDKSKPHSFREGDRWRSGMKIQFYAKVRQKGMYKIMPDMVCKSVQDVFMTFDHNGFQVSIDDRFIYKPELLTIAKRDGFNSIDEFSEFFFPPKSAHNFWSGQLIHWTDLKY